MLIKAPGVATRGMLGPFVLITPLLISPIANI
jgi:hypothetical protein